VTPVGRALAGKRALVTGGSRGIGLAIAGALAAEGAALTLLARDATALAAAAGPLGARTVAADAADAHAIAALETADILVHAAGLNGPMGRPLWQCDVAELDAVLGSNLRSALLLCRQLLPGMVAAGWGRIVLVGGTFGLRGRANRAAYSAAKFGLRGLARSIAHEAGPHGVTANVVCPGLTRGPRAEAAILERAAMRGVSREAAEAELVASVALRRLVEPEEVAAAVLFLCGPGGGAITGQELVVDCGATA
jgi:NAD(P)-dependent dehydrogenase (short-subunit alcohol dehydrogenase family)